MLSKTNFKIKVDIKNRNFKEYSIRDYERIIRNFAELREQHSLLEGETEHIVAALSKQFKIKTSTIQRDLQGFLQQNSSIVEDLTPYEGEVNGAEIANNIESILKQYAYLENEAQYIATTLWVFLTYSFEKFSILPMLLTTSPTMRCGKTTLLMVLEGLVYKGLTTSNISPSATFRIVDKFKPSLLIDEADRQFAINPELQNIVNSGHTKRTAFVIRTGSKDNNFTPERFNTFCPKVIAMIGQPVNTWIDRSIRITMNRKPKDICKQKLPLKFYEEKQPLRQKLLKWASQFNVPEELESNFGLDNDRAEDNWCPLIHIAKSLGNAWFERAKEAMFFLEELKEEENDIKIQLLKDIGEYFKQKKTDKISSANLVDFLNTLTDKPWADLRHGKGITPNKLANMLKDFGIKPRQIKHGQKNLRGYELNQFEKTFNSYIPPQSATPLPCSNDKGFSDFQSATKEEKVALSNERKLPINGQSSRVAVSKGGIKEDIEIF